MSFASQPIGCFVSVKLGTRKRCKVGHLRTFWEPGFSIPAVFACQRVSPRGQRAAGAYRSRRTNPRAWCRCELAVKPPPRPPEGRGSCRAAPILHLGGQGSCRAAPTLYPGGRGSRRAVSVERRAGPVDQVHQAIVRAQPAILILHPRARRDRHRTRDRCASAFIPPPSSFIPAHRRRNDRMCLAPADRLAQAVRPEPTSAVPGPLRAAAATRRGAITANLSKW